MTASIRSLLFTPATRPERFAKALACGTDALCIDLEDAVAPPLKAEARRAAVAYLADRPAGRLLVGLRVNALASADGVLDLAALIQAGARPDFVMIPKVATAGELSVARGALGGRISLCPLIETAAGLRDATAIAAAPGVGFVLFGAVDLAADLGSDLAWEAMLFARGALAAACAEAGRPLLDAPATDIADLDRLSEETDRARRLGFTGRACIHPAQVPVVNAAYTPSQDELAWAGRVVKAFEASDGGAALLDGKLIEAPVVRAARRLLERAPTAQGVTNV